MSDLIERLRKDVSDLREKYSGPRSFVRIEDPRKFLFAMTDAADRIEALEKENAELLAGLRAIIDRSHNGELGTSKVIDMRNIAERALTMDDIHREQLARPRFKPSEAEGREG